MADIDPLEYRQRSHPELTLEYHGNTPGTWTASSSWATSAATTARS